MSRVLSVGQIFLAVALVACVAAVDGALPGIGMPTLGQALWLAGFAKSFLHSSSIYAHDFGLPKSGAIGVRAAGGRAAGRLHQAGAQRWRRLFADVSVLADSGLLWRLPAAAAIQGSLSMGAMWIGSLAHLTCHLAARRIFYVVRWPRIASYKRLYYYIFFEQYNRHLFLFSVPPSNVFYIDLHGWVYIRNDLRPWHNVFFVSEHF